MRLLPQKVKFWMISLGADIFSDACDRFGKPNGKLSTSSELRFGRRGSLSVNLRSGLWFDHELGEGGSIVDGTVRRCLPARTRSQEKAKDNDRVNSALRLFNEAQSVNNTLAEGYLRKVRRLTAPLSADLCFHGNCPRRNGRAPAMLALIRNIRTDEPQGVHRTFLKPDGSGRDGEKMMLGAARDGVVKLSNDADVSFGLGIAEGLESALSVLSAGWAPIWAALSAGGIRRFPVLGGVETLTIFADADDAGLKAAEDCARRWSDAGREVRIVVPFQGDWNDAS